METFENHYKDKTVLVTGHTGFKGSWLSIWLKELGANVIGYGLDPYTDDDIFVVSKLGKKITDIRGDIRDSVKLKAIISKYQPQYVFHLAAQSLVRLSYKIPKETYEVNVLGTLNVLECIRDSNTIRVGIMVTSDKCYENKEQIWPYRESDPVGGYDPYSSSKGCGELLIASYRNSFFTPAEYKQHGKAIASVRAGNVIGGGDWAEDRLVPDCIRALRGNKEIEIRNPKTIRPWQYVLEPLCGYLRLASQMFENGSFYGGAWNFGPKSEDRVPVETIVNTIVKLWGSGKWIDVSSVKENIAHESQLLSLDCTKAKVYLNWQQKLDIYQALHKTIEWYKNDSEDKYNICLEQIRKY